MGYAALPTQDLALRIDFLKQPDMLNSNTLLISFSIIFLGISMLFLCRSTTDSAIVARLALFDEFVELIYPPGLFLSRKVSAS